MASQNFQVNTGSIVNPLEGLSKALSNISNMYATRAKEDYLKKQNDLAAERYRKDREYRMQRDALQDKRLQEQKAKEQKVKDFVHSYIDNNIAPSAYALANRKEDLSALNESAVKLFKQRLSKARKAGKEVDLSKGIAGSGLFTPEELRNMNDSYKAPVIKQDEVRRLTGLALENGLNLSGNVIDRLAKGIDTEAIQKRLDEKNRNEKAMYTQLLGKVAKAGKGKHLSVNSIISKDYSKDVIAALKDADERGIFSIKNAPLNTVRKTEQKLKEIGLEYLQRGAITPEQFDIAMSLSMSKGLGEGLGKGSWSEDSYKAPLVEGVFEDHINRFAALNKKAGKTRNIRNNSTEDYVNYLKQNMIGKDAREEVFRDWRSNNWLLKQLNSSNPKVSKSDKKRLETGRKRLETGKKEDTIAAGTRPSKQLDTYTGGTKVERPLLLRIIDGMNNLNRGLANPIPERGVKPGFRQGPNENVQLPASNTPAYHPTSKLEEWWNSLGSNDDSSHSRRPKAEPVKYDTSNMFNPTGDTSNIKSLLSTYKPATKSTNKVTPPIGLTSNKDQLQANLAVMLYNQGKKVPDHLKPYLDKYLLDRANNGVHKTPLDPNKPVEVRDNGSLQDLSNLVPSTNQDNGSLPNTPTPITNEVLQRLKLFNSSH